MDTGSGIMLLSHHVAAACSRVWGKVWCAGDACWTQLWYTQAANSSSSWGSCWILTAEL